MLQSGFHCFFLLAINLLILMNIIKSLISFNFTFWIETIFYIFAKLLPRGVIGNTDGHIVIISLRF